MQDEFGARGLRVVAVNAWDEPRAMVAAFAQENNLTYTILLGGGSVFERQYKGRALPTTCLVDPSGKIVYVHLGWEDRDKKLLADKIEALLAKPTG